jgi:hypothetical protein
MGVMKDIMFEDQEFETILNSNEAHGNEEGTEAQLDAARMFLQELWDVTKANPGVRRAFLDSENVAAYTGSWIPNDAA